jgi:hypothetical protein
MIRQTMIAAAFLAAPALAKEVPAPGETNIPRMSAFLEWLPDGSQALYVRGDTGRWYHVALQTSCPRLRQGGRVRFDASPGNRFDRHSAIRADGWRCMVSSVTHSDGPPPRGTR